MNSPQTQTAVATVADFSLDPPAAVAAVPAAQAAGKVKLKPADIAALDKQVADFVDEVMEVDPADPRFKTTLDRIRNLGTKDIEAASQVSNRMLDRPTSSLTAGGSLGDKSSVGGALVDLRRQMEELDPSTQGDLFAVRKILGFIPMGNKLQDFFDRYKSAQSHLNEIIVRLKRGKDSLEMDNAAIELEKVNLWGTMERLEKSAYLLQRLDAAIEQKVLELRAVDPDRARALEEDLLFETRQKTEALMKNMAVNIQGYLALGLVLKTNQQLMRGVENASTTTLSSLRTAVLVAQALGNQKLVLDMVVGLDATTSKMILGTSKMLQQQTAETYKQASSSGPSIEDLKQSFQNVYSAIDSVGEFKQQALIAMKGTIASLKEEIPKAKSYVARLEGTGSTAALQSNPSEVKL